MEGFEDPFNRGTFPWGKEDQTLLGLFRKLGRLRNSRPSLQKGDITYVLAKNHCLAYTRVWENETTLVVLNTGEEPVDVEFPWAEPYATDVVLGQQFNTPFGQLQITVPPLDGMVLI